jgi:hypothetical protein
MRTPRAAHSGPGIYTTNLSVRFIQNLSGLKEIFRAQYALERQSSEKRPVIKQQVGVAAWDYSGGDVVCPGSKLTFIRQERG